MKATWCLAILLVTCNGCGAKKGQSEPVESAESSGTSAGAGDIDIEALLAREAKELKSFSMTGPKGAWKASALAASQPTLTEAEGVTVAEIPIGSEVPVRCQLFPEDIDPAGTVAQLLAEAGKRVEFKQVMPAGIHIAREAPLVFVDAMYHMATPGGKAAGELKVAVHPAAGSPVLCFHDEVGFKETFARVAREFCESFESARPDSPPAFVEIQTVDLGSASVGFDKHILETSGGERRVSGLSSMFIPVAPGQMQLVDDYSIEVIDKSDRIKEGTWVEASGGEIGMQIKLTHVKGPLYRYEGSVQGKSIKGEFRTKDAKGLSSSIATARKLAVEAHKPKGFSLKIEQYVPDLDPLKPFEMRYFRPDGEGPPAVHLEAGNLKLAGRVDDQGLIDQMDMPAGGGTLNFRRQFVRGKLR